MYTFIFFTFFTPFPIVKVRLISCTIQNYPKDMLK